MQNQIHRRRRRKWLSYLSTGCHYNAIVYVVHRCPIINGVPQFHLSWVHKIVPA